MKVLVPIEGRLFWFQPEDLDMHFCTETFADPSGAQRLHSQDLWEAKGLAKMEFLAQDVYTKFIVVHYGTLIVLRTFWYPPNPPSLQVTVLMWQRSAPAITCGCHGCKVG
jgi:hypothetical protein